MTASSGDRYRPADNVVQYQPPELRASARAARADRSGCNGAVACISRAQAGLAPDFGIEHGRREWATARDPRGEGRRAQIGRRAREFVRYRFLNVRTLIDCLQLIERVLPKQVEQARAPEGQEDEDA